MPIYEYECTNCNHHFDLMQKISDEPLKRCPECKEDTVIKLISAAGFQLKGTGWYATDFKNKNTAPVDASAKKQDPIKKVDASTTTTQSSKGASHK